MGDLASAVKEHMERNKDKYIAMAEAGRSEPDSDD